MLPLDCPTFPIDPAFGLATLLLLLGLAFSEAFFGDALVGETLLFLGLFLKSVLLVFDFIDNNIEIFDKKIL